MAINSMYHNCNDRRLKTILAAKMDDSLDTFIATYTREFNSKYVFKSQNKSEGKNKKFDKNHKHKNNGNESYKPQYSGNNYNKDRNNGQNKKNVRAISGNSQS